MIPLIHSFLEASARRCPENEAVVHGKDRLSYQDVERRANQIARWLFDRGVKKGDRVALVLRNSADYICAYYGALKVGAVAVPMNTGIEASEMEQILVDCTPRALFFEKHFSADIDTLLRNNRVSIETICMSDSRDSMGGDDECPVDSLLDIRGRYSGDSFGVDMSAQDLSSIIYTSGSTGKPKGVVLSHLNVVSNTQSIVSYLGLTEKDRCLVALPLYYVYGKSLLNTHFAVGGAVIIDNRFAFPNAVLKTMLDEGATGFAGVPSTYSILLNRSSVAKMSFPELGYLTQAGGHMPVPIKKRLLEVFHDKRIYVMYGATEASARLSYVEPDDLCDHLSSIGKPIPNVDMTVFKGDGTEAGIDEEGEIAARGSNIMLGYWGDEEESAKVLKNGWYLTGDLGYRDEDGFYYVTGRKRDMIKAGIHKISATEIEDILYEYPGVQEAAVIGVFDEVLGETAQAVIVGGPEASLLEGSIVEWCKQRLPSYKVPAKVAFADSLPKNESGKILKKKLAETYSTDVSVRKP